MNTHNFSWIEKWEGRAHRSFTFTVWGSRGENSIKNIEKGIRCRRGKGRTKKVFSFFSSFLVIRDLVSCERECISFLFLLVHANAVIKWQNKTLYSKVYWKMRHDFKILLIFNMSEKAKMVASFRRYKLYY